jgi:mRNA interferase MazF
MVIRQGDVFWVEGDEPLGSEPGLRRPYVVIQNDAFNLGRIQTVVVCALTTNLRLASAPGNVLLAQGEANLPKTSVVNVTQILTVDKAFLVEKSGSLSHRRLGQILRGIHLLLKPVEIKD